MHTVYNERIKLTATILNSLAAAFVVAGFVAPAVNGSFGGAYPFAWIIVGAGLHYAAAAIPGRLRK